MSPDHGSGAQHLCHMLSEDKILDQPKLTLIHTRNRCDMQEVVIVEAKLYYDLLIILSNVTF